MNKNLIAIPVIVLAAAGIGGSIAACSSGPGAPPSATSILQGDGYTPSSVYTSDFQNGLGSGASLVSSSQAGTNGDNVQVVIVVDTSADAGAVVSALNQQYSGSGLIVTSNNDVVTITGNLSTFAGIGS